MDNLYRQQMLQGRLSDTGSFPNVVLIDTCSYCNLRCSMCPHKTMTRKPGLMKPALFGKIVDEIAERNKDATVWLVFFGEALIRKVGISKNWHLSIFEMVKYAKSVGLTNVVLNSNGVLLDDYSSRRLIESGLDSIFIGIDAASEETYNKLRVGGNYSKVIENVHNFLVLKQDLGVTKPEIVVQFVEMEENKHEIETFKQFWLSKEVTVKVRPQVSWAGKITAPNLTRTNRWPCHWAMQTMSITDQGKVVLCAVDLDAQYVVGDVNDQSMSEIWNGPLAELRDLHQKGLFHQLPKPCRDCKDWQAARSEHY